MEEKQSRVFKPMTLEEEMAYVESLVLFDMFGCEGDEK